MEYIVFIEWSQYENNWQGVVTADTPIDAMISAREDFKKQRLPWEFVEATSIRIIRTSHLTQ